MDLSKLFVTSESRVYKRGDHIYKASEAPLGLYFIKSGLVSLVMGGESGSELLLRLFKPGQILGHRALFAHEKYHASAIALESTTILFLSQPDVKSLIRNQCDLAETLLNLLAVDLRIAEEKLLSLTEKDVTTRIAETLIYLKEMFPDHNWTRQEIANYCGSTAATVIRTLSKFEEDGLIEQNGRQISILKKNLGLF
jgi:CRP-like cAMP-binding protein